jgi:hypothetical protein
MPGTLAAWTVSTGTEITLKAALVKEFPEEGDAQGANINRLEAEKRRERG